MPTALRVVVVSRDAQIRTAAARAFEAAPADWDVSLATEPDAGADVLVFGPDAYPGTGLRFDPSSPERVLADAAAAARRSHLVAVTGAGGGAGATTLALHLAHAWGAVYADFDLEWGAAARLGLTDGPVRTWAQVEEGEDSLRLVQLPVSSGLRAMLSPCADDCTASVTAVLDRADAAGQRIVADVPAGPVLRNVLERAGAAVLVMPPSIPGAHRARRVLDCHPEARWAVVTNRLGPGGETMRAGLQAIIGRRIAVELPCSPTLRDAEDSGALVCSRLSRWRRAVERLARALGEP